MAPNTVIFSLFFLVILVSIGSVYNSATLPPPYKEQCLTGTYPPKGRPVVPTYTINLDLPPEQRWNQVAKAKAPQMKNLLYHFKKFLMSLTNVSSLLIKLVDDDLGPMVDTFPYPFNRELKGIAHASGLPLGEVVLYNIFYEVFTVCTSIVAQDQQGHLIHGRNLDFGLFIGWNGTSHSWSITDTLRPAIVNLDWQRGGRTVFKSVNYAGYVGILTAVKPKIFTFSMDERFNVNGGYIGILEWMVGYRDSSWMGFLTRSVMENATSYTQAQKMLATTPMLAPAYFILGGNKSGEASVITRARDKALDIWKMNVTDGNWFILETNYDHWKQPFFLDDRRGPANRCMQHKGQKSVSFASLFDVFSSKPVLNKLTTYTALMNVTSGQLETYLQYCPDPCFPW